MITEDFILKRPTSIWGRAMFRYFPYRKAVILANIEQVYGDKISVQAKAHLVKAFYSHLIQLVAETIQLRFLSEKKLQSLVDVQGLEHLLSVAEQGKGVLILTGHLGNWEFAPLGGMSSFHQYRGHLHFIRRNLGVKFLENILFRRYHRAGLRVIGKKHALHQIFSVLENNHAVVFVLDQHASIVNRDGITVDFFGKPAGTYRSLAMVANYTQVPVVPAMAYRQADKRHVLKFFQALPWLTAEDANAEILNNTQQYNHILEQMILEYPEQWWWLHKRWKL